MSRRTIALIIAIAGLLVGALFALADVIGLGQLPGRFGLVQIAGVVVGALLFIGGIIFFISSPAQPKQ